MIRSTKKTPVASLRRLRGAAGPALALVLGCAVGIGLVEAALRLCYPARTRYYVWPPGTTWVVRPDPKYMPGVEGTSRFIINADGIRGRAFGPDTEHRILALGGSTTECTYLDEAEAWPGAVQLDLSKTPDGRDVWLGSIGKSGASGRDHVVQLKHLLAQLPRLDTVLVLVGVNDLTVALSQGDAYVAPPPMTSPEAERLQIRHAFAIAPGKLEDAPTDELFAPGAPWFKRMATYQLLKQVRRQLSDTGSQRGLALDERGEIYARWRSHRGRAARVLDRLPDLTAALGEYRRNLDALADIAARRSVRLVLMTQPTLWRRDLPEEAQRLLWLGGIGDFQIHPGASYYSVAALAEAMRRFNAVLLEVCRARDLDCLDLAERIPRETTMFYDDCHFTEAGSRAVATAVAEHLRSAPPFAADRARPARPMRE